MNSLGFNLLPDSGACRLCAATAQQQEFWPECLVGSGQTLRRCGHCGAIYLGPDFTEGSLNDFYARDFRKIFLEGRPETWRGKRSASFFRQRGDDGYAALRLGLLTPFLPADGSIFELGSGSSAFLGMVARHRPHLTLFACEPDDAFRVQRLDKANVQFLPWGETPAQSSRVKLIAAFHTLEHIKDVNGFLHRAMATLQPGGHLAIEVPDVLSAWTAKSYVHPAHLTYFSRHSLERVLRAAGFEIVTCGQHPAKGVLTENIWAVARKPTGKVAASPIAPAPADEIATLDRKLASAAWTWKNRWTKRLKYLACQYLPLDFLAGIKRKRLYQQRMLQRPGNFPLFEFALRALYGGEAAAVRHEAYFLSIKSSGWRQRLRATLALLRDMTICATLPPAPAELKRLIAIVSLARFRPIVAAIAAAWSPGSSPSYIATPGHRRELSDASLPAAPSPSAWRKVLLALIAPLPGSASLDGLEPWTLRCCMARHRLWVAVMKQTLRHAPVGATILLHNDFDMFSRAAVSAARDYGIRSICVQHGLPTDEYFPTSADQQLVWGRSSADVYLQRGTPASAIMVGSSLFAPALTAQTTAAPSRIVLISQTHTRIYGEDIPLKLKALAERLCSSAVANRFEILLHPEEARKGHLFTGTVAERLCRLPPHALLATASEPALVIGYCSTALLDAARAGHYVAALDWPAASSLGAIAIGRPPALLAGADDVIDQFTRLNKDEILRREWQAKQVEWLAQTFSPLQTRH